MLQNNLYYFKYSVQNPEKHPVDILKDAIGTSFTFLPINPRLNEYVKNVKDIKETLITIKKLMENNEKEQITDKYFVKLQKCLDNEGSNQSEFICFAHACDTTLGLVKNDIRILKELTKLYLKNRDITELTPREWIQALLDSQSARRKGISGESKLINLCIKNGYKEVCDWRGIKSSKKAIATFRKKDLGNAPIASVFNQLGVQYQSKVDKSADLLIKNNSKWVIVEAKHLNVSGGDQDKQLLDLIEFISIAINRQEFYLLAFLGGSYSNKFLSLTETQINNPNMITGRAKKRVSRQRALINALHKYPNSFWVNTAGFVKFIDDFE